MSSTLLIDVYAAPYCAVHARAVVRRLRLFANTASFVYMRRHRRQDCLSITCEWSSGLAHPFYREALERPNAYAARVAGVVREVVGLLPDLTVSVTNLDKVQAHGRCEWDSPMAPGYRANDFIRSGS